MSKNILTSGYKFNIHEFELELKYVLFNTILLFNILFISIAALARSLNAQYTQTTFDIIYVILGLIVFAIARHSKEHFLKLVYFVITYSFFIITYAFYIDINPIAGATWYIVLIMAAFFLTDRKSASIVAILSTFCILAISVIKYNFHSTDILIGVIPLIVAYISIYFFDKRNSAFKIRFEKQNAELDSMVKNSKAELFKLQQILQKSPVSIIITDVNGNIEYANPWFSKVTGYTPEEFKGQNPRILKSDFHSDEYYDELWDEITHDNVWNGTFRNINKEGKEYWESAIIAPVKNEKGELSNYIAIKQEITEHIYLKEKLAQKDKEKVENFEKTLDSFVRMVEERDTYTAGHSERVANYSLIIAKEMKFSIDECNILYRASILHDIGKIATPDNVLLKPGKLSDLEYKLIQEHVQASYDILSPIPMYKELAEIIRHHHEHYDGSGYPHGLKGDEIPLLSHIMIIADAFDAMTTNRIYKVRKTLQEALKELENLAGKQFHPEVVKYALKALGNIELHEQINQLPKSALEKERFSYFYRDQITNAYNADYLKLILNQNNFNEKYACINTLYMHNFSKYNKKYGWTEGDKLLKTFAEYLSERYPSSLIFRIHGNNFVLISKEHVDIDLQQFKGLKLLTDNSINLTKFHTDERVENVSDLEEH
jgi:PAS domain S-box-containing protein/putative nucleotidyltransferase with HDIG domain